MRAEAELRPVEASERRAPGGGATAADNGAYPTVDPAAVLPEIGRAHV